MFFGKKKDSVPTQPRPSYPFKNNTSAASPTYVALNSPKMSSVGGVGVGGSLPPGGVPPPPPPPPSYQQQRVGPLPALPDVLRPSEDQSQHSTFFQSRGDYTQNKKQIGGILWVLFFKFSRFFNQYKFKCKLNQSCLKQDNLL